METRSTSWGNSMRYVGVSIKGDKFRITVPKYYVDTEIEAWRDVKVLADKFGRALFGKMHERTENNKLRFFAYSDAELDEIKSALNENQTGYSVTEISLTPHQQDIISECEKAKIKPTPDKIRQYLTEESPLEDVRSELNPPIRHELNKLVEHAKKKGWL